MNSSGIARAHLARTLECRVQFSIQIIAWLTISVALGAFPATAVSNDKFESSSDSSSHETPPDFAAEPPNFAAEQPDFAAEQEECRGRIERLRIEFAAAQSAQSPVATQLAQELELWERLELIVDERRSAHEDRLRHQQMLDAPTAASFNLPVPNSYLEVDDLRAMRDTAFQKLESLRLELKSEIASRVEARGQYSEAEQVRRKADESFESSSAGQRVVHHRAQILARLQSRVMQSRLELHREQAALLETRIELVEAETANLAAALDLYRNRFRFAREELELRLAMLAGFEEKVRQQLKEVEARLRASMHQRVAHSEATSDSAYEIAREESQLLRQLLSGAGQFKECWRRRYSLSNFDVPVAEIEQWSEEVSELQLRVDRISEKLRLRTRQRRESLSLLARSVGVDGTTTDPKLIARMAELEKIIDFYGEIQNLATGGGRLCQLLSEDLDTLQGNFSLSDNLQLLKGGFLSAWNYEIATIDDEPITVKKVILGLMLLLVGYFISRAIASVFANRVLPRFGVSHSAAAVLRTLLLYSLLTALVFVSLDIVNVPLTVFAFLGGAVAIGVGFGSQNLINNFISGLILLVERPIRIGDLVNVDGIDANVEHIGARSTRVRTGSNLEIMVPNSKFLENNVTNWTLSDTRIRTSVNVGVAYGSPVREVIERLREVISNHEKVLQSPEPIVLFRDFGESSLAFEVHFWVHMKRVMDGATVRSDVRASIDDDFRKAGIVIAFPQRDVHIDMSSPIEVRLADDGLKSAVAQGPRLRRAG